MSRRPRAADPAERALVSALRWGHISWQELVDRLGEARAVEVTRVEDRPPGAGGQS